MITQSFLAILQAQSVIYPIPPTACCAKICSPYVFRSSSFHFVSASRADRCQRPVSLRLSASLVEQGDGRRYLAVPYAEKVQAKALGAKWDPNAKSWYDPGPDINAQLNKWLKDPVTPTIVAPVIKVAERKYLNVPYANKDEAKSLGAKWDMQAKLWYDPVGSNPSLEKWSMNDAPSPK